MLVKYSVVLLFKSYLVSAMLLTKLIVPRMYVTTIVLASPSKSKYYLFLK